MSTPRTSPSIAKAAEYVRQARALILARINEANADTELPHDFANRLLAADQLNRALVALSPDAAVGNRLPRARKGGES